MRQRSAFDCLAQELILRNQSINNSDANNNSILIFSVEASDLKSVLVALDVCCAVAALMVFLSSRSSLCSNYGFSVEDTSLQVTKGCFVREPLVLCLLSLLHNRLTDQL